MMKLTIFGSSGRTGIHLAEQALAAGHDVVAFVRNPAKLDLRHERLQIVQGELTDAVAVEDAVRDADAVLATLAPNLAGWSKDMPVAAGTRNIVAAMPHDKPGSGRVTVRTATGSGDRVRWRISRADLAGFMLAQADDLRYARQEVRVSN
ncbi:hypothetical protein ASF06_16805 [Agreia sp. Leaf244]|uniref:NAD(P)-dependent oxidoreductase n=1 Tax=Agreia sp. Leaf244 TaxID=1736305 RepID=UPI0006F9A1F1|nr:NAD(P)H-binding protein [Agreia sp. Leaf244]KQO06690.1 hypothetical protein ASF06_16805 [Agreia sp. Leaf244]